MIKRENAAFKDSSRLYVQAKEAATYLLKELCTDNGFLKETCSSLRRSSVSLKSSTREDLDSAAKAALKYFQTVVSTIDPNFAIPVLMEMMDEYYYRDRQYLNAAPWLGIPIKMVISAVWGNRHSFESASKGRAQIIKAVQAASAYEQIRAYLERADVLPLGNWEITDNGFSLANEDDRKFTIEWNEYTRKRGEIQRTIRQSVNVIWLSLNDFVDGATRVIQGASPSAVTLFKNSLFEFIEEREFWLGLYVRLLLLFALSDLKNTVNSDIEGIVLFESYDVPLDQIGLTPLEAKALQAKLYWDDAWYKRRLNWEAGSHHPSEMVVERCIVKINETTFATSPPILMDSINYFVERSVMGYDDAGVVKLSSEVFRKAFSAPFEEDAASTFVAAGWTAGTVNEQGFWAAGLKHLTSSTGDSCPGEIDVLAVTDDGESVVVGECKVLKDPTSFNRLRNIVGKLGQDDSDQFHSKLRKKVEWIKSIPEFFEAEVTGILIVDRGAFLAISPEHQVVNLDDLKRAFNEASRTS